MKVGLVLRSSQSWSLLHDAEKRSHCQTRSSVEPGQKLPICSEQAEMNIDFGHDNDFTFTGLSQHSRDSPALCSVPTSQQSSAKKRVGHIRCNAICHSSQPRRTLTQWLPVRAWMLSCRTTHRGVDMLPQPPGLGPHITRTPTPPWAVGMEESGLENAAAGEEVPERSAPSGEAPLAPRKAKRVRILLDRRIELTDDELKVLRYFCRAHSISVIDFG